MALHRAILNPTLEWGRAWKSADETEDQIYEAALARLGLTEPEYRNTPQDDYSGRGFIADHRRKEVIKFYALIGDDAAMLAAYNDYIERQASEIEKEKRIKQGMEMLNKLLDLILDGDLDLDDLSSLPRRPASPPAAFDLPEPPERSADDAEPSGADDVTRWLDDQFDQAA